MSDRLNTWGDQVRIPDIQAFGTPSPRVLTCVYCGHEYPQNTPSHGSEVLTEHIKVCEKHPMRKLQMERDLLRKALANLVGASDKDELEQMEIAIRLIPAPAADKVASIDAIHALIATA